MRKSASSRSSARSSRSRRIESRSSNLRLERKPWCCLAGHRLLPRTYLFQQAAAQLAAAFPRSLFRIAARTFCYAAFVYMAFLSNTGEKDDRAVADRSGPQVHAARRWFESNKVTHWLLLRIRFARVPAENKNSSLAAKPTVRSLIRFRGMAKNERRCFNKSQTSFTESLTRGWSRSSNQMALCKDRHDLVPLPAPTRSLGMRAKTVPKSWALKTRAVSRF